jgi:hypothetical protein
MPVKRPDFLLPGINLEMLRIGKIIDIIALIRPPKHELVFIWHLYLPICAGIVSWNTNGCPPVKMGVNERILVKERRIRGMNKKMRKAVSESPPIPGTV